MRRWVCGGGGSATHTTKNAAMCVQKCSAAAKQHLIQSTFRFRIKGPRGILLGASRSVPALPNPGPPTFALPSPCTRMLRHAMSRCTRPREWMWAIPAAICLMKDTSFLQHAYMRKCK